MLASRGPLSLHASRDGELSSSQDCLLHPCVFGSVRKFFLKVILALSPAPPQALRSSPGGGQGKLPLSSRKRGGGCPGEVVGVSEVRAEVSHIGIVVPGPPRAFLFPEH